MSPEVTSTIQTIVITIVLPAIAGIIGVVAKFVIAWLEAKRRRLEVDGIIAKEESRQKTAEFHLQRLDHIVANSVGEAEQKKPSGEKQTAQENADRFDAVKTEIIAQVQPEIMHAVSTIVRNPYRYVDTKIEAAVGEIKRAG